MYILDTNICIFAIKKKFPQLLDKISEHLNDGVYVSSLTVAELEYGVSNSQYPEKNRIALLEFLSIFNIMDFRKTDAVPYGIIKTNLRRNGNVIDPIDMLLAAQGISNNMTMVTNNIKEFERVEGLKIEDWS